MGMRDRILGPLSGAPESSKPFGEKGSFTNSRLRKQDCVRGHSLFWKAIGKLASLLTVLYIHLFEHLGMAPTVLPTDAGHEAQARVLMLSAVCQRYYPWNPIVIGIQLQSWDPLAIFAFSVLIRITFLDHSTQNCTLQTQTYNTHMHTHTYAGTHTHRNTHSHPSLLLSYFSCVSPSNEITALIFCFLSCLLNLSLGMKSHDGNGFYMVCSLLFRQCLDSSKCSPKIY